MTDQSWLTRSQSFWVSIVLYNATLMMIKLTFLIQYYRVLGVYKMKRVIWMTGVVIMMWAFSQLLVVIFSCTPVQKFWQAELEGQCMPNLPFWYINAAGNIATDLAILVLPLPVLAKLKLRRQQKYILLGIFCLGFLYVFLMWTEKLSDRYADTLWTVPALSRSFASAISSKALISLGTMSRHPVGLSASCALELSAHAFRLFGH